jgi:predicted ATPase
MPDIVGFAADLSNEYSCNMDLHSRYQTAIRQHGFSADNAQSKTIESLARVANELASVPAPGAWPARLKRRYMSKLAGELANTKPVCGA